MNKIQLLLLLILAIPFFSLSQNNGELKVKGTDFNIVFDAGLLLGHSESYYPAPFSSNISFLKNFNNRFWIGGGSGAEIIGKTFVPIYADARYVPFSSKPFFLYNKLGWTVCTNKNYSDGNENDYYYRTYPHPLDESITTRGGLLNETGVGVFMRKADWRTSLSIGFRYQKTSDHQKNTTKVYENTFSRVAFRLGFWF
ncbi:MAG: hypothetical protein JXR22_06050 [Prolixibacteraceae bacterium]|nr:hypothetical protein [Prolixibacteraceae bacterium]